MKEGKLNGVPAAFDRATLAQYSTDASVFRIEPSAVAFPKNADDIKALVDLANNPKSKRLKLSLTARAAGSCMSGGSLTESVSVDTTKYLNKIIKVGRGWARCQPGVFYRDLEKQTLRQGYLFPSYPASKAIAAVGGIVSNNSGGELSLKYGKTQNYVTELKAVLSDGNEYVFGEISEAALKQKMRLKNFEGEVYTKIWKLIKANQGLIESMRPHVSKDSTGYLIWEVWNPLKKTFNLAKLLVGSQGTLGIITEVKLKLVKKPKHARMLVLYLGAKDMPNLAKIVNVLLATKPTDLEAFDDKTLKLALKYAPQLARLIGEEQNIFTFAWSLLPDFAIMLNMLGLPKLVILAEYQGDVASRLDEAIKSAVAACKPFKIHTHVPASAQESEKYWTIRRQSFNLLRKKITGKQTVPFIDDFVVAPKVLPQFLPRLNKLLAKYPELTYTTAGHIGNGNFHIIPLMDLTDPRQRAMIQELAAKVYDLVFQFKGSMSGEHNDGLIRGPFLKKMYGPRAFKIFAQIKAIFDPNNIFNPGKKTQATFAAQIKFMKKDNEHAV